MKNEQRERTERGRGTWAVMAIVIRCVVLVCVFEARTDEG